MRKSCAQDVNHVGTVSGVFVTPTTFMDFILFLYSATPAYFSQFPRFSTHYSVAFFPEVSRFLSTVSTGTDSTTTFYLKDPLTILRGIK